MPYLTTPSLACLSMPNLAVPCHSGPSHSMPATRPICLSPRQSAPPTPAPPGRRPAGRTPPQTDHCPSADAGPARSGTLPRLAVSKKFSRCPLSGLTERNVCAIINPSSLIPVIWPDACPVECSLRSTGLFSCVWLRPRVEADLTPVPPPPCSSRLSPWPAPGCPHTAAPSAPRWA